MLKQLLCLVISARAKRQNELQLLDASRADECRVPPTREQRRARECSRFEPGSARFRQPIYKFYVGIPKATDGGSYSVQNLAR